MTFSFADRFEAERIARIVEMWNPSNDDLIPWRDDVVSRMRRSIDGSYWKENVETNCTDCPKDGSCDGERYCR